MKRDVAFNPISFAVLAWNDCLSAQLPYETHMSSIDLRKEQSYYVDQNGNDLEFELCRA